PDSPRGCPGPPVARRVPGPRRLELVRAGRGRALVLVSHRTRARHRRRRLAFEFPQSAIRRCRPSQPGLARIPAPPPRHGGYPRCPPAASRLRPRIQPMSVLTEFLHEYWPHLAALLSLAFSLVVAAQAAMQKNDVRAAIAWVGVILMSPFVGAFLYLVAGINRIRHDQMSIQRSRLIKDYVNSAYPTFGDVGPVSGPQFASLRVLCDQISRFPLQGGNHVVLLDGGDQAYPAMLQAIDEARHCIALQSYIFDHDRIGLRFADALRQAQERGVEIRVLIDAVGARYSHPPILRLLERNGIRVDRFMTNPLGLRSAYANLRSHRKILF